MCSTRMQYEGANGTFEATHLFDIRLLQQRCTWMRRQSGRISSCRVRILRTSAKTLFLCVVNVFCVVAAVVSRSRWRTLGVDSPLSCLPYSDSSLMHGSVRWAADRQCSTLPYPDFSPMCSLGGQCIVSSNYLLSSATAIKAFQLCGVNFAASHVREDHSAPKLLPAGTSFL